MQCNINAKGKAVRLVSGFITVGVAAVIAVLALAGFIGGAWVWVAVAVAALGGAFQIFEGWSGWCVVRAAGFRTPL